MADDCAYVLSYFYGEYGVAVDIHSLYQMAGRDYTSDEWYMYYGGMRFLNITIPQGATILSAYLKLKANLTIATTTVNTRFEGQNSDDTNTFVESPLSDYENRPRTVAKVDCNAIPAWTKDVLYTSNDLKTIIQEIINRAGWVSGNSIVIFWNNNGSSAKIACARTGYSFDSSAGDAPTLEITYEEVGIIQRRKLVGVGL